MEENWDMFPSNIKESLGAIERHPFTFNYRYFEVWQAGRCISRGDSDGQIKAEIINNHLHVTIVDANVNMHIVKHFSFGEISTNDNRILWSKDLFNTSNHIEYKNPNISSLFFKNGILSKVTYTIDEPNTLVEFYQ